MKRTLRLLLAMGLLAILTAGLVLARHDAAELLRWVQTGIAAVQALGPAGWALFMAAQFGVASFGLVPASLMGVAAGVVYGLWLGFVVSAVPTLAGAALSFWLARSAFRSVVHRLLVRRGRLARVDAAIAREGWRLVCLLRMNPVMPFAPTSFALGLSAVGWPDYLLGTLAALPALLIFVALGSFADAGLAAWQDGAGPWRWVLLAAAVTATAIMSLRLGWLAARAGLAVR